MCRQRGLAFAALSDHAEDVDESAMAGLVEACDALSHDGFALIPGLEHRLDSGVHILALGQKRLVAAGSPIHTLARLSSEGCVLIAAHCPARVELTASLLEMLSAVEIWNVSRHTRYLPTSGGLVAYRRWAEAYPNLFAIGGLDMHSGSEWGCEVALDRDCEITPEAVLTEIRKGRFCTKGRFVSFDSRPNGGVRDLIFAAGDALAGVRDARNRVFG
jgi:hypothetical protein